MEKETFENLKTSLLERGYKKFNQQWHHEDYVIAKGFHKKDNQWEENRNAYQILISVYDYTLHPEYWERMSNLEKNHVGLEIHVGVSRNIDERIDMIMAWHDDDNIEDIEAKAESFYQWVCKEYPEPRKEIL